VYYFVYHGSTTKARWYEIKLKFARIISIMPIILALLTAGCDATKYPNVHPVLGILTLVFSIVTTASLFLLKQ
jgi:hypothetical protein